MDLPVSLDPDFVRAATRAFHFIGLALGLGTATFLDLILLRFMLWGEITRSQAEVFALGTRVVTAGLFVLWVTGLMFLWQYASFDPHKLHNPKIWAKLGIVGVLSANAVYLHALVLPVVTRQISRKLFAGVTLAERIRMVCGGAISAVSWYVPLALGAFPQLNFSLSAMEILVVYLLLLGLVIAAGISALVLLREKLAPAGDARNAVRDNADRTLGHST